MTTEGDAVSTEFVVTNVSARRHASLDRNTSVSRAAPVVKSRPRSTGTIKVVVVKARQLYN